MLVAKLSESPDRNTDTDRNFNPTKRLQIRLSRADATEHGA